MSIPWEALVALFIWIVGSTFYFVWWMATITADMKTLQQLVKDLSINNALFARKEDVARELGVIENNLEKVWEKYDKLKEKVDSNGNGR